MRTVTTTLGPHQGQPLLHRGAPTDEAQAAVILVPGRGGRAVDMLRLADEFHFAEPLAWVAPQAAGFTWYPQSFLAPREANEPGLSSGLARLEEVMDELMSHGIPPERIGLLGFSQGACLALEFAARRGRRLGGVVAFSGGLIGPEIARFDGDLSGTPFFLGCSDRDPHIPLHRVRESTEALRHLGGEVQEKIYPGMPHTIVPDEIAQAQKLFEGLFTPTSGR